MAAVKSTLVAVVFIATKIPATKLDNSEDVGELFWNTNMRFIAGLLNYSP